MSLDHLADKLYEAVIDDMRKNELFIINERHSARRIKSRILSILEDYRASETRKLAEGRLREYSKRGPVREAEEAGNRNRLAEGREE